MDFQVDVAFVSEAQADVWVEAHVIVPSQDAFRETRLPCEARQRLPASGQIDVACDIPVPSSRFDPSAAASETAFYAVEVTTFAGPTTTNDIDGSRVEQTKAPMPGDRVRFRATYAVDGIIAIVAV